MKKILFLALSLIVTASASAQRIGFGPRMGYNIAMINDSKLDARMYFNAGAFVEYDISAPWSIELACLYSGQGATEKNVPISLVETAKSTLKLDYINIPVVAKFYPWMGMNIFAGPQLGILVDAHVKTKGLDKVKVTSEFEKIDLAAVMGLGYTWECGMMVTAQYNLGLTNIAKKSEKNRYNGVCQINVGWRF